MEDLSYHYSPKARDFMSTQTTNMTSSRLASDCNLCPRSAPYQKEDLTVTDLKREYSKALNCIEILKLEKKNLQDALTITKDFKKDKTEKFFVSSTRCTTAAASPKADFNKSVKSVEVERRVIELEQELLEQQRLLDRSNAHNEQLKRENYNYRERLQEVEDLQLQNHQLRTDVRELTEELRRESRRVYELEDENDQLLDRRNQVANSARKLPPRDLYKYLDHVYELIGSLNRNHYAHYHFRECFIDEDNIEALIEDKETNELLLQSFRYITNLLVNISSGGSLSADQRRASRTLLTDSESDNQRRDNVVPYHLGSPSNGQHTTQDDEMHPHNPTPNANLSKNINLNTVSRDIDAQPHSFGDANPLSQQDLSPEHRNENSYTKVYSPSHSRNMISSSYSNKPNTDVNSTRRELSRNPSYKSGISVTSPQNRREKSPSSKHVSEANATANVSKQSLGRSHVSQRLVNQTAADANALNMSKQSLGRSHVSQRLVNQTAADANALNMSKQSLGRSHVSQRPMTPVNQTVAEANALNVSKQSLGRSHVSQRPMTPANQTMAENNALNMSKQSQGKSFVSRAKTDANLNVSKHSQGRSHVSHHTAHHTTHQNVAAEDYYEERSAYPRNMTPELEDKEIRLRELDRELQEKDRLLQMKEKELKDRSVMDKSMSRYNRAQEEAEMNKSRLSQSRKLASQKSLLKDKSALQSKQRIDESREQTRVLKSQTQLKDQSHVEYERANTNLNKSNLNVQSRIIPSMTSLNEIDTSPKGFGASPKHTQTHIKSLTRVANSVQSIDPHSEYQRSPKTFTSVNSQKFLNAASAYDVHDVSASRLGGQRVPYQEAYMGVHSFENSPQSKISPKPQILERLENSGIKLIDQRGREDYDNSQVYEGTPMAHLDIGSPKSENTRRHITFDVRNLGDIQEIESSPQSKSLSRKMSVGERSSGKKGTEYASFRVSFGRTQSKYMRSQSPDVDAKDSLYIVDVARRKRVTHHEQTYDVVQGNEVRYDLQSMGSDYSVSKSKPRSRYEAQSQNQSGYLERMASPQGTCRVESEK